MSLTPLYDHDKTVIIDITKLWKDGGLTSESYKEYKDIIKWLDSIDTHYRFMWTDTGQFLPNKLVMYKDSNAVYFKLKYNL